MPERKAAMADHQLQDRASTITLSRPIIPLINNTNSDILKAARIELNLEARAKGDGQANKPETNATGLSDTENDIIELGHAHIEGLRTYTAKTLEDLRRDLSENEIEPVLVERLRITADRAVQDAQIEQHAIVKEIGKREHQARRELNLFEYAHGLAPNSAKYQSGSVAVWAFSLILLTLLIAESLGNAVFLQELSDYGIAGGLLYALGFGFGNVACAFLCGWIGLRLIRHVQKQWRAIGWVTIGTTVLTAAALLIAMAKLRHNPSEGFDPFVIAKPWLWPAALGGVAPVILVLVGTIVFLTTMLKARGGAHAPWARYWNHDKVCEPARLAAEDLAAAKDNLGIAYQNAYDEQAEKVAGMLDQDAAKLSNIRAAIPKAEAAVRTFEESCAGEGQRVNALLRDYRTLNRRIRSTDAPAYFAEFPDESAWRVAMPRIDDFREALTRATAINTANTDALVNLENALRQGGIDRLHQLDREIEDAENRIRSEIAKDETLREKHHARAA
jgi:hypothetical protein